MAYLFIYYTHTQLEGLSQDFPDIFSDFIAKLNRHTSSALRRRP
jgi:hypothetical protein